MSETQSAFKITAEQRAEIEKVQPMWKIVLRQFFDHRAAVAGAAIILILSILAIGAPLIANLLSLNPEQQNALNRYARPMTTISLPQDQKDYAVEEFIQQHPDGAKLIGDRLIAGGIVTPALPEDALFELMQKDTKDVLGILKASDVVESKLLVPIVEKFETLHFLGTDELGRDVFIRLIFGARISLGLGILVAVAAALIGLLVGGLAGYYGGVLDSLLMRYTDAMLSLPLLPILIVIAAVDLNKLPWLRALISTENESIYKMLVILLIFSWMTVARLVRGSVLSLREREFILAARTLGARDSYILIRHVFPNVIAPLLVSITLGVGQTILFEAALSFLGLGIQQPTASWGNMLQNSQELINEAAFLAVLPGLMIFITTISINYIGDGLQDAIDPKAIRR